MTTLKRNTLSKKQPVNKFEKSNLKMQVEKKDKYKKNAFVNFEYSIAQKIIYAELQKKKVKSLPHMAFMRNCEYHFNDKALSIESVFLKDIGKVIIYFFYDNSTVYFHDGAYLAQKPNTHTSAWGREHMPKEIKKPINKSTRIEKEKPKEEKTKIIIKKKNHFGVMK